jgi:uncharacterized protein YhfF
MKKVPMNWQNWLEKKLNKIEGEGDKSLKYWRKVHMDFFIKELKEHEIVFSQNTLVVFVEFEMVYT